MVDSTVRTTHPEGPMAKAVSADAYTHCVTGVLVIRRLIDAQTNAQIWQDRLRSIAG